jgi:hypothetical protein
MGAEISGRRRLMCDIAYCCFVITCIFFLLAWLTEFLSYNAYTVFFWFLLYLIPPSGFAALVGIVLSLIVWRHWPLPFLSLMTLLLLIELLTDAGTAEFFAEAQIAYAITCFAFTLVWFTRFRKRYQSKVENDV